MREAHDLVVIARHAAAGPPLACPPASSFASSRKVVQTSKLPTRARTALAGKMDLVSQNARCRCVRLCTDISSLTRKSLHLVPGNSTMLHTFPAQSYPGDGLPLRPVYVFSRSHFFPCFALLQPEREERRGKCRRPLRSPGARGPLLTNDSEERPLARSAGSACRLALPRPAQHCVPRESAPSPNSAGQHVRQARQAAQGCGHGATREGGRWMRLGGGPGARLPCRESSPR